VHPVAGAVIGEATNVLRYNGSGPNPGRQTSAHAHQAVISPNGRFHYVCDLGADCIHFHAINQGIPTPIGDFMLPPGSGPRHLLFHPSMPLVWVVCELMPLIVSFIWNAENGRLENATIHSLSSNPPLTEVGAMAAIHLHPSGKLLGVSDRATHSICLFDLDNVGRLTFRRQLGGMGKTPRDFNFSPDGRWLIAAYQESHSLTSHAIDADLTVAPHPTNHLSIHSPVCVLIVPSA
jgi:6-phosphogluconolactonase